MDHLLNWLWQGVLVALTSSAVLAIARRASAQARYRVVAAALLAVLALPLVPFAASQLTQPHALVPPAAPTPTIELPTRWWTSDQVVVGVWSIWALVVGAHVTISLVALARARRSCQPLAAAREMRLSQWQRVRGIGRATQLVQSDAVRTAAVFGGRSPIIAIHPTLLASLSDDDLDRVIVHEWTHVQRRDDFALFAQLGARLLAGWHPAVWWLDRQLHFEREVACDEQAVSLTGSARAYAGCLVTLASLPSRPSEALPVLAACPHSGLRRRVSRILVCGRPKTLAGRAVLCSAVLVPLALAVNVAGVRLVAFVPQTIMANLIVAAASPPEAPIIRAPVVTLPKPAAPRRPRTAEQRAPATDTTETESQPAERDEPSSSVLVTAATAETLMSGAEWPVIGLRDGALPVAALVLSETPEPRNAPTLWSAAASGGVAIGRRSQKAALSTAGFFTRVGRSLGGSF